MKGNIPRADNDETGNPISTTYNFCHADHSHAHAYLLPVVKRVLSDLSWHEDTKRIFDLGCGNGSIAASLSADGYVVTGVDPSVSGIAQANSHFKGLELEVGSAYDPLAERFGQFPAVISLEVVEHVYYPRVFAKTLYDLVKTNGTAILSTPFHGYWKNLMLATAGAFDRHFTALMDHGHIKFWSVQTLSRLLLEAGFRSVCFQYAGRFYPFSKSMIAIASK